MTAYGTFDEKALLPLHGVRRVGKAIRNDTHRRRHRRRHVSVESIILSSWMAPLPDNLPLSSLSIPGTHDSAAFHSKWPFVTTQTLDLTAQLYSGIRYFDFRCGLVADVPVMVHGQALLDLTLSDALEALYTFLNENPTEALIVQIKQDRAPDSDTTVSFPAAICSLIQSAPQHWLLSPHTPTLGQSRSRILLFRRFTLGNSASTYRPLGIDVTRWMDNPSSPFRIHHPRDPDSSDLVVQDRYNPAPPAPLPTLVADKTALVAQMLNLAAADPHARTWYLNFCSAYQFNLYYQDTPREVAVGGWWFGVGWVDGVNVWLAEELRAEKGRRRRLGVVVLDYLDEPDAELVGQIVATNFGPREGMRRVKGAWVVLLVVMLALVFCAGTVLVLVHGPVRRGYYCTPWLHACAGHGWVKEVTR